MRHKLKIELYKKYIFVYLISDIVFISILNKFLPVAVQVKRNFLEKQRFQFRYNSVSFPIQICGCNAPFRFKNSL